MICTKTIFSTRLFYLSMLLTLSVEKSHPHVSHIFSSIFIAANMLKSLCILSKIILGFECAKLLLSVAMLLFLFLLFNVPATLVVLYFTKSPSQVIKAFCVPLCFFLLLLNLHFPRRLGAYL
jgi:hypothetical protein